ncbi:hypothetical protein Enr13x_22930 [Stieleria neptunia]|uniref:DUF1549 domain-containing protein n=1 Tax=Stieleria neptunia TaxID=2527979 RepID=A0A518HNM4_9BACT|nr:DUF1549 domain-containing protein [Stieleria neptunia]QDV42446.1 hypothetical protein Enr13x_22930 [Stieleria neptunia]
MKLHRAIHTTLLAVAVMTSHGAATSLATEAPIDAILATVHREAGITPTERCDDHTYLRRISLDLLGRVPTADELARFDALPDRGKTLDRMLHSDEFSRYWSQLWTTILIGRGDARQVDREALRRWFQTQLEQEKPLDQIAFDLISAEGVTTLDGHVNFLVGNREDPVTPVSRIFLGVQLDCARCHDHPFDRWTQDDYTAMRRFFQTISLREVSGGIRVVDSGAGAAEAGPRFLTGSRPRTAAWRRELALMTVRCQPFARAMGNRVWQLLIGRGIVDPVDGLSQAHPPSVPELHQALADQLRGNGFDLRGLIRTIAASDAYARTAPRAEATVRDEAVELFAARIPRPLLPEQLIASYATVMHRDLPSPERLNTMAVEFMGRSEVETGATDPLALQRTSQGLLQELAAETSTPSGDLDSIFRATLSRRPDEWERQRLADVPGSDLLYVLLHGNEFVFSH